MTLQKSPFFFENNSFLFMHEWRALIVMSQYLAHTASVNIICETYYLHAGSLRQYLLLKFFIFKKKLFPDFS